MNIATIGDLKKELERVCAENGWNDQTPIKVAIQACTQRHPAGAFPINFIEGSYEGGDQINAHLRVGLPEGFVISERKTKR